ncbi:hypothetical protein F4778DRAFT_776615 [Xylariomycetidae sp. FL2044]|nr:hypothetical protein F4778DRAFT_776615 [Xylariomycetidae sp. FL2044]
MAGEPTQKNAASKDSDLKRHLLILISITSLILSFFAVFSSNASRHVRGTETPESWEAAANSLMSRSTVEAFTNDELLRRNWLAIIEVGADTSDWLADVYDSKLMKRTSESIKAYRRDLHSKDESSPASTSMSKRRPGLFDFLDPNKDDNTPADDASADDDTATADEDDGGFDLLGAIGDLFNQAVSGLGDAILGDVAGTGTFLGVGVGAGAAQGLNLTTAENAKAIGSKVLADNGLESSGLNPALQNLGMGAAAALIGSIDLSSGLDIGPVVMNLASGLGTGAVTGLEIAAPAPPDGSDLASIAGMLGFGLANSLTSNLDLDALSGSDAGGGLTEQLPAAVLSLAQGLGSGAVTGLKINDVAPPTGTEIPDIAGTFGFGLTQSVTSNLNLSDLSSLGGGVDTAGLMDMLPAAAAGLGKGLGEGIPIGLGIQEDPGLIPSKIMPEGQLDVSSIAENFAMGLTSHLLANDTLSKLMSSTSSVASGLTSDLNIQSAAGGLARGLLQGVADSVDSMGGVQAFIDGTATTPPTGVPETAVQFNDSVNGAAIGFGQGFGSQGVVVAQSLFGKVQLPAKRSTTQHVETRALLDPRQDDQAPVVDVADDGTTVLNISALINAEAISSITQKGIDLLTCRGVGGVGLVLAGISSGGSISGDALDGTNISQLKDFLPKGNIKFTNEGHLYEIDIQSAVENLDGGLGEAANAIQINGNKIGTFLAFLIIHILFGILAFFGVLPLVLGLESARNILIRIRKSHILPNVSRWNNIMWFAVIAPSMLLVLVFGALAMGTSRHFRTPHGIVGLLDLILGIAATAMHFLVKARPTEDSPVPPQLGLVRNVTNSLFLIFSLAATLTGFTDLSRISICLTQTVSFEVAVLLDFGLSGIGAEKDLPPSDVPGSNGESQIQTHLPGGDV